jgi:hypothetical protein
MNDPVFQGYLQSAVADCERVCRESDCVRLRPDPTSGDLPRLYHGLLKGADHYVRDEGGSFVVTRRPISFQIHIPDDFLLSLSLDLQFRVVRTSRRLVHPNVAGGVVCLGGRFRPGTRLRSVVEQFYLIATSRVAAMGHPFDLEAAEFYLAHQGEIRGFRSEPLWRRPVAASVRVEARADPHSQSSTETS